MAQLMGVDEICIQALRKIQAYVPSDTGPDGNELNISRESLDIVLKHYLSSDHFWFVVSDTLSVTLAEDDDDYDLKTELGASWPSQGIAFPVDAALVDSNGNKNDLTIIRRDQWDNRDQTETGRPREVFFDRSDPTTIRMRTWPTISTDATTYTAELTVQKFAKQVWGGGVAATTSAGLEPSFNMWAIYALSCYLGDGTIKELNDRTIDRLMRTRNTLFDDVKAFANAEHADDHICEPWGQ